ncbi:type IV pilus twitching motility protein PilT [Hydrogenophaga laconesensis]|uniref:type IV pilus twitching motility protein PilT n=1 Tax=Hydrogenophaga laconesensis TaxID=1805971 RepID=UPI00286D31D0|nr:ATPase, T2SS/T4P/T4SS family [Hydrogenophaga laconesensis]
MLSVRRIPTETPNLAKQGLPSVIRVLLDSPSGLILVSGPTGSGKTTTMAAMVDAINDMRASHVVTVEDPIEYLFTRNRSVFSQREVGVDCGSFLDGVRAALRQRPDVIVIGEIRDRETAEQAFVAGESGHLVIGTLHASSAVGTVGKMLSFFKDDERESRIQSMSGTRSAQGMPLAATSSSSVSRPTKRGCSTNWIPRLWKPTWRCGVPGLLAIATRR